MRCASPEESLRPSVSGAAPIGDTSGSADCAAGEYGIGRPHLLSSGEGHVRRKPHDRGEPRRGLGGANDGPSRDLPGQGRQSSSDNHRARWTCERARVSPWLCSEYGGMRDGSGRRSLPDRRPMRGRHMRRGGRIRAPRVLDRQGRCRLQRRRQLRQRALCFSRLAFIPRGVFGSSRRFPLSRRAAGLRRRPRLHRRDEHGPR